MSRREALTILFADVSGSTRLFETLGDVEARRLVAGVLGLLDAVTTELGGTVIKTIGDEIMCTFPDALSGLEAAAEMQRRVSTDPVMVKDRLAIRIGLHHGETLVEERDVFGDAVNVASRMESLAKREQIVTTASTVAAASHPDHVRTRSLGSARVAGKSQPIEIVDLLWQEDTSSVTTLQRMDKPSGDGAAKARLMLHFKDRQIEIEELAPPFTLGREEGCNLVVEASWVSRLHASIEYKRGFWVLGDRSTNGTWVRMAGGEELRIHRDEIRLRKDGIISLGQESESNESLLLQFRCAEAE